MRLAFQIRSLEKTLEEAVSLGALRLSGRKLKEVSAKLLQKYDLSDTIIAGELNRSEKFFTGAYRMRTTDAIESIPYSFSESTSDCERSAVDPLTRSIRLRGGNCFSEIPSSIQVFPVQNR